MKFECSKDYYYDGTTVLKNNLGIKDKKLLFSTERKLTSLRMSELHENPIKGKFDFDYLKEIHYRLFQDLYPWAGQIRRSEIAKLDLFCLYDKINYFANIIFSNLVRENYYIGYDNKTKLLKLVELFGDINGLHPFREGNGRSQREFIENLAAINGITLDLTNISQEQMVYASHSSMNGDNSELYYLFKENSEFTSLDQQLYSICKHTEPVLAKKLIIDVKKTRKKR